MIQPNELQIGSMFEYNVGDKDFPKWELRMIDLDNIRECIEIDDFHSYRGIPLTEKILTEWCGATVTKNSGFNADVYYLNGLEISLFKSFTSDDFALTSWDIRNPLDGKTLWIESLHHLQRLILALTNQPLKIELK